MMLTAVSLDWFTPALARSRASGWRLTLLSHFQGPLIVPFHIRILPSSPQLYKTDPKTFHDTFQTWEKNKSSLFLYKNECIYCWSMFIQCNYSNNIVGLSSIIIATIQFSSRQKTTDFDIVENVCTNLYLAGLIVNRSISFDATARRW
mgnify:CR=1 FL=1